MKRVIAMVAVFVLTALVAGYVALAPLAPAGGALATADAVAARVIAIGGRGNAVLGLMALGVILSLLAAFLVRGQPATPGPSSRTSKPKKRARDADPEPLWLPDLPLPEERIASLRRRAIGDGIDTPAGITGPLPPRPVALIRIPRSRDRDWFADRNWLGGLPRLGDVPWPRDVSGLPLPFAAQVDLGELSMACPESPLPTVGSLAFFLGTGAVAWVPPGDHDFTEPPGDLPPAFDEGGYPFPATVNRLSRYFFPFWPVYPAALDIPDPLRDHRDPASDAAIEQAIAAQLALHARPRGEAFAAQDAALWWHGVAHLAGQLHEAFEGSARLVALRRDSMRQAEVTLNTLEARSGEDDLRVQAARSELAGRKADLAAIEAQRAGLPDMMAAIDQFTDGRAPWQQLTLDECGVVAEFLNELHARFGDIVRFTIPDSTAALATLSLRTMITGEGEALSAMPEEELQRINQGFLLPLQHPHQMFGLGGCQQSARDGHRGDILLLQLGYDDMMEWRWGDMGLFQFWISPQDAAQGRWEAAELTFECA